MMLPLPLYLTLGFVLTTGLALWLTQRVIQRSELSSGQKRWFWGVLVGWLGLQTALTLAQFYQTDPTALPPKFPLVVAPTILAIVAMFVTPAGRQMLDRLDLEAMTWLHVVRVPVELVLYGLFIHEAIPEVMTFAGRNWDILAGLTAPIVAYWGIRQGKMSKAALRAWNLICLGLLLNIVIHAVLALPSAIQQIAFDQPNVAVLNFPFVWLPAVIVPLVMLAHLASIRQLVRKEANVRDEGVLK